MAHEHKPGDRRDDRKRDDETKSLPSREYRSADNDKKDDPKFDSKGKSTRYGKPNRPENL